MKPGWEIKKLGEIAKVILRFRVSRRGPCAALCIIEV
jgi:hypothetical protein